MKEYAVVAWHPEGGLRYATPIGGGWTRDIAEAERHYLWLTGEHRTVMEAAAAENEADGFKDGNYAWYQWHNPHSGRKHDRYAIVQGDVSPTTTLRQEEGFAAEDAPERIRL